MSADDTPIYDDLVATTGVDPLIERDRPVIGDDGAVPASTVLPPLDAPALPR